ncbi:MAG: VOC family protein [Gammaproteobacteria bacterium]|nr:VOC family protein [Gammaproteobacteria bacterium]MDH5730352.1 VOC family protein [Gammaproteobacteria bacterium]
MSSLTFKYTILYVENVEKTLEFFEKAFALKRSMLHESGDYAELQTGSTKLAFSSLELMQQLGKNPSSVDVKHPCFEIAFETDDVGAALEAALAAGAHLVQACEEMPWGQTTAYVSDTNGFLIELCSPVTVPS